MSTEATTTIMFDGAPMSAVLGGRYELYERIGKGGMAEVFRGCDTFLKRNVAIKIMLPRFANDPTFTRRFEAEAQAAAQLRSPHTVEIYDVGVGEGRRYIVMELIQGKSLKEILEGTDKLPPRNVARFALQTCLALKEAHAAGIVHRDIKPANIMIAQGDRRGSIVVKITDFGIAKAERLLNAADDKGRVMGTPRYMSPEQFQGSSGTASSDLYSLGIVMYEAVTGCTPFIGVDTSNLAEWHEKETPIRPRLLRQEVDDNLDAIIMKALQKNPEHRYANSVEFADDLELYLASHEHVHGTVPYPKNWVIEFVTGPNSIRGAMCYIDAPCIIGRGTTADVIIPDTTVSREHLLVTPRGMYLELKNLSKSNGTLVNGTIVRGKTLCEPGTTCQLGNVQLRIGRTV